MIEHKPDVAIRLIRSWLKESRSMTPTVAAAGEPRGRCSSRGHAAAPGARHTMATASAHRPASLTGAQKVAVLYMALGPARTALISDKLSPEEVESIGFEVARMGVVQGDVVDRRAGGVAAHHARR
jgi:hypothetical protein